MEYPRALYERAWLADAVINSSSDAIITKDLSGRITSWNKAAERMFGYTQEEVINQPITILFPQDSIDEEPKILARIKNGEIVDPYETIRKRKDGSLLHISLTVSPLRDHEGRVIGASKIARDITEQKQSERIVQHMAAVVESTNDGIITKDLNGLITSWNLGAERIFGYSAQEAIGQSILMLFPDELKAEEIDIMSTIRRNESISPFETVRKRKDGTLVPISLTISPMRNRKNEVVGASKIVRDITAQKQYEKQLISQAHELEQFAYIASHDLKEPLRKVALYSEMLIDSVNSGKQADSKKYIANITNAVKRMQRLISDVLAYSKADRADTNFEKINLNSLMKEVLNDLEVPIKENGARITVGAMPAAWGNMFQIHQVFQNLISNAIKFRRSASPLIEISAQERNKHLLLSISDNGIGIDPQYKEKIFRVFQRLHTSSEYPGTGIGLAICKKIIERHGGEIWFESTAGQGTTFLFTLPKFHAHEKGAG